MSSVRERLDTAARTNEIDVVRPSVSSTPRQAGSGESTREAANRRAYEVADDPIVKLDPRIHGGLTGAVQYPSSLRERLAKENYERQQVVAKPDWQTVIDYYYAENQKEQARKQAEAEAEAKRNQELIAKNKREALEQAERLAAQPKIALQKRLLDIAYSDVGATPAERNRVEQIIRRDQPGNFGDPQIHKAVLWKVRQALHDDFNVPCSDAELV